MFQSIVQTLSPQTDRLSVQYPVMEHFYTIQGEGYWTGNAAYFIRLGGCDVGCFWCDVKESWDADVHPKMSVSELVETVGETPAERVVITGGEPSMHDLTALSDGLRNAGLMVHIETSGTSPLRGKIDWICFSPKKFKEPLNEYYAIANELKIVVHNKHDLVWAEGHAALCQPETRLYLQPEWSRPESAEFITEYVKANPRWRVSLQTHKYLNIP